MHATQSQITGLYRLFISVHRGAFIVATGHRPMYAYIGQHSRPTYRVYRQCCGKCVCTYDTIRYGTFTFAQKLTIASLVYRTIQKRKIRQNEKQKPSSLE